MKRSTAEKGTRRRRRSAADRHEGRLKETGTTRRREGRGNYKKCRVFFLPFSRGLPKIFRSGHQDPGINTPPANNLRLTKTPPPNPAHTKKANTSNLPRSLHTRPKTRHASRTTTIENPTTRKSRITLRQPVEKTETAQKPNTHPRATPETRHTPSPAPL